MIKIREIKRYPDSKQVDIIFETSKKDYYKFKHVMENYIFKTKEERDYFVFTLLCYFNINSVVEDIKEFLENKTYALLYSNSRIDLLKTLSKLSLENE